MTIKVDKKIPLPAAGRARYPWAEMEVGDSFLVAGKDVSAIQKNLASCAGYQARNRGRKYVTRAVKGGVRAWRIA